MNLNPAHRSRFPANIAPTTDPVQPSCVRVHVGLTCAWPPVDVFTLVTNRDEAPAAFTNIHQSE